MSSFDRLRTALSRVPLATSGAIRRIAEDPDRVRAAARTRFPHRIDLMRHFRSKPKPNSTMALVAVVTPEASEDSRADFWRAVAADRYDEASILACDEVQRVALARLGGHLRQSLADASSLSRTAPTRSDRRRASRVAALARREIREYAPIAWVRDEGVAGGQVDRALHVVTNALPDVQAGYTIRTDHIVRAQRAAGLEPHVVTRPGFPVLQGHLIAPTEVSVHGVPYHRLLPVVAPSRDPYLALRQHVDLLAGLTRRVAPQVLHPASGFANAQAALGVRDITGTRVVYEARGFLEDSWASRHGGDAAEATDRYLMARDRETDVMLAADAVVTLGEAMRAEIAARGVAQERIFVVPNGVDEHFLAPLPDKREVRARLGVAQAELIVGIVTTMYHHEGVVTLVDAVAQLRAAGVDARLVVVGSGPDLGRVRSRISERGLDTWSVTPGQVPLEQVRDWYDVLDVFALPRIDSRVTRLVTPLKPVEAMARALPVVASDLPALAEIIGTSQRGRLVRPDDPEALAVAMGELVDARVRADLGAAAREWVAGCRTWAHAIGGYSGAYSGVADGR